MSYLGLDPRNAIMKDTITVEGPGYLLTMDSTNDKLDLTAVSEIAIGVSVGESERAIGSETGLAAGALISFYPLGGVLMIQATAGQTWTVGATVYATNAGLATTASGSSAKKVGLYVGGGETVPSGGGMIPVNTMGAEIA